MDESKRIPANDELVNDLINDFKSSCNLPTHDESADPTKAYDFPLAGENPDSNSESCPCDAEDKEKPVTDKPKPEDYIDEDELRIKEEHYSQQELIALKDEADNLKLKGNELFKNKEYNESAASYTLALRTCPLKYTKERAIFFANRAAAKIKLELTEPAIEDCSKSIELDPNYLKPLLRRAQLYESTEKFDEALADFQKVLEIDPSNTESIMACKRLPDIINERNEKLKTEMLGKLKDLGNMILRPFGLSTNNFQMNQDPNTGSYSINFKQN